MKSFVLYTNIEDVENISKRVVEDWIFAGKAEKKWMAKTIKNHLMAMSLFVDWLIEEEYMKENVVKRIPKPRLPKRIPKHLPKDEALELLEWARNYPYSYKFERSRATAIMAVFLYTGVRLEELRNLKVEDLNLENRTLFVRSGKGNKDRIIPLNTRLIEFLEVYLKDRKRLEKSCPYFFTAMRENAQMGDSAIKRLIWKIREKSGIYFHPHMLRHTFAVLMLEGGCDLFSLSKMMGHSDIKTTTIYLSATTAHLQEQIVKHPLSF